jgi:hypothetical protein
MFRATTCPSSGETTVSMRHLAFVTPCGWMSGMQVSQRYSYFSWWWAHIRPKHVERRNKHTKKNCAPKWLYLQDYKRMRAEQNLKILQSTKLYTDSVQRGVSHMGDSIPSNKNINNCLLNIYRFVPVQTMKTYIWSKSVSTLIVRHRRKLLFSITPRPP